jgi:hypothetical protein
MDKPHKRASRIPLLEFTIATLLTITVVSMWTGSWTWWPSFMFLYGCSLSFTALFLTRTPKWFWPTGYKFKYPYGLGAVASLSLLVPLGIFELVEVRTPLAIGNVEYVFILPFGSTLPLFLLLLPMFGLQAFCSSAAYLVTSKLVVRRTGLYVETSLISSSFYRSLIQSLKETVGVLNLAVVLIGAWLLKGDATGTLSWIVALQFYLPISLFAIPLMQKTERKHRTLSNIILSMALLFSLVAPEVLPGAPSIFTVLWRPTDWRGPLLASSTLSTLWGMAVARAYMQE